MESGNVNNINRHLASHLRRKLANGYPPTSTFIRILNQLSDAELIRQHEEFHADSTEHKALLAIMMAKAKEEKPSMFAKLTAKAVLNLKTA